MSAASAMTIPIPPHTRPNAPATSGITSPKVTFDDSSPTIVAAVISAMKALIFMRMIKTKTTAIAIASTASG